MPEVVSVSSIDRLEKVKAHIQELFKKGQYSEITQSIGMYSILIDPQHTLADQKELYGFVLDMLKKRTGKDKTKQYAAWLAAFPKLMAGLAASDRIVTDKAAVDILADYHKAYGPFKSVDEFFSWALADRRLPLEHIVKYIEKTVEMHRGKA